MKVQSGNVTANIEGLSFIDKLLKQVAPNTKKIIDDELQKIYEEAVREWPVRKPKQLTEAGRFSATARAMLTDRKDWKGIKQALAVAYNLRKKNRLVLVEGVSIKSQDSKGKMTIGIKLSSTGEIVAFIGNRAQYAWAIRVGEKTDTSLPYRSRVSNELLFKPMKKSSNAIALEMAKEIK